MVHNRLFVTYTKILLKLANYFGFKISVHLFQNCSFYLIWNCRPYSTDTKLILPDYNVIYITCKVAYRQGLFVKS